MYINTEYMFVHISRISYLIISIIFWAQSLSYSFEVVGDELQRGERAEPFGHGLADAGYIGFMELVGRFPGVLGRFDGGMGLKSTSVEARDMTLLSDSGALEDSEAACPPTAAAYGGGVSGTLLGRDFEGYIHGNGRCKVLLKQLSLWLSSYDGNDLSRPHGGSRGRMKKR